MDIQTAYKMVFEDILENGPSTFYGECEDKAYPVSYLQGIRSVMEYIASCSDSNSTEFKEQFKQFFDFNVNWSKYKRKSF